MNNKDYIIVGVITLVLMILSGWFGYYIHTLQRPAHGDYFNGRRHFEEHHGLDSMKNNKKSPHYSYSMSPLEIDHLKPMQRIESPLVIEGMAPGTYFFEASFPIELYNSAGEKIATAIAQAQDDWMTESLVRFKASVEFDYTGKNAAGDDIPPNGKIVFVKDDPSGEHPIEVSLPIVFGKSIVIPPEENEPEERSVREKDGCVISGCSGQVCSSEAMITDCQYQPEYICFGQAMCEKQEDGECSWTITDEVGECVQKMQ